MKVKHEGSSTYTIPIAEILERFQIEIDFGESFTVSYTPGGRDAKGAGHLTIVRRRNCGKLEI